MSWLNGVFNRDAGANRCLDEENTGDGVIKSAPMDADINDLAGGINESLNKAGQNAMTGSLDMGGNDITNVNQITSVKSKIEDTSSTVDVRTLLDLSNNGGTRIDFNNTSSPFATSWSVFTDSSSGSFKISTKLSSVIPFEITNTGDIVQAGVTLHASDRNKKKNITAVDTDSILDKVSQLPISTWQYKDQDEQVIHMGPMAQDFRAVFGLGINDVTISDTDVSGVALAAIKGLYARIQLLEDRLDKLEK